jgi:hypothetical protein
MVLRFEEDREEQTDRVLDCGVFSDIRGYGFGDLWSLNSDSFVGMSAGYVALAGGKFGASPSLALTLQQVDGQVRYVHKMPCSRVLNFLMAVQTQRPFLSDSQSVSEYNQELIEAINAGRLPAFHERNPSISSAVHGLEFEVFWNGRGYAGIQGPK